MTDVNGSTTTNTLDLGQWTPGGSNPESSIDVIARYQEPTQQPSVLEVSRLLAQLPQEYVTDYNSWLKVGMVLYHEYAGTDIGLRLWEDFSKRSDNYGGCDEKWSTFGGGNDNPVTLGSLKHWGKVETDQAKFQTFNLDELLESDFKVDYLIDGFLVDGQPCLCAGPQKSLKTTLLMLMGLCLSRGVEFLGHECKKRRVLFMSGESGIATLQETAKRMLDTLGGEHDTDAFHLSPMLPRFDKPLDSLEALLVEKEIEVLIVDPIYLCMNGADAGNMFQMGQQLATIANLCTKLKVTPVLAHHTTKKAGQDNRPLAISDMAWSGSGEFARQWLLLSRRNNYVDGTGEHKLYLRAGGSAGHSNLFHVDIREGVYPNRTWAVETKSALEINAETTEQEFQGYVNKIRDIPFDEPLSKTKIREALSISGNNINKILPRLVDEGVLIECNQSQGHPTYKLGEQSEQP